VQGLPVFHARASVLLDAEQNLVALSNHLAPDSAQPKDMQFTLSAEAALAAAYSAISPTAVTDSAVTALAASTPPAPDEYAHYTLRAPDAAPSVLEAHVKRVLYPGDKGLVPAYHAELVTRAANSHQHRAYAYTLDARDGSVLTAADLTAHEAYTYRVWAEPTGNHLPTDGPLVDSTPLPGGVPTRERPAFTVPNLISTDGFNKNPSGVSDPWLASGATTTLGNNVTAYSDRDETTDLFGSSRMDGFDSGDVRADTTAMNAFDRTYDTNKEPDADKDQMKAAITQVFYTTNWLHDYWYDSGFNEAAGNAQQSNYGRGGIQGDPLRAEAQDSADSGAANNANMSVLDDGLSPRMQMYVWSGLPARALATEPAITFDDELGAASYGPQTFDTKGDLFAVNDNSTAVMTDSMGGGSTGPGTTTDGCQRYTGATDKIAVVDRGACTFVVKVQNAQRAGAKAIIVLDNAPGHSAVNPATDETVANDTLPLLALSYEDGVKLRAALAQPVSATRFYRGPELERDGTIDNTVVAHEWGHYLHHRLTTCNSASCDGMSEGWADFNALMLVIHDGDAFPGQVYPLSQYAAGGLNQSSSYFGTRRAPYSVDMTKNPFTFKHIRLAAELPKDVPLAPAAPQMNEAHNVGEVWAEILFEAYASMITAGKAAGQPFDSIKRRMADYVVAGMKAAPENPTFVEQRDSLLAAAQAMGRNDPERAGDFAALAAGFAKRGLGQGAVAPPAASTSLNEAKESFTVLDKLTLVATQVDDSARSCDADGALDAGEAGTLTLTLGNQGWKRMDKRTVRVLSSDPAVQLDNDGVIELDALEPYRETSVKLGVHMLAGSTAHGRLHFSVDSAEAPAANSGIAYNFDDVADGSVSDDVESEHSVWLVAADADTWTRELDSANTDNHVWHGDALGAQSDQSLSSPPVSVSESEPLVISWKQRYAFETGRPNKTASSDVAFDGGVLEVSQDGGTSWSDISQYVDPGYDGTLYTQPSEPDANPLSGRRAFTGQSRDYPEYQRASLDLGRALAGKTVQLRFRIGTDHGVSAPGWDIDDIAFEQGVTSRPFHAVQDNATTACAGATE
jgi:hypothetical protein